MSSPSSVDTAFRFLVMLGVLAAGVWGAATYTPVVDVALRQWDAWQHPPQPRTGDDGGDAPLFPSGGPNADTSLASRADGGSSQVDQPPGLLPKSVAAEPIRAPNMAVEPNATTRTRPVGDFPARQTDFEPSATQHPSPPGGVDSFGELDAQLGRLGAVYTLLERWGHEPVRYRFHCKVALAASSPETRRFEAIGDDPLRLMRQVVDQVTAWRAGRTP